MDKRLLVLLLFNSTAKASLDLEDFEIQPVSKDTVLLYPRVTVLTDVGIIRCAEQCLGNKFCLSFYYRKSTRTCILNAFRLPVGINPSDAISEPGFNLYTSKYKVVAYPSTCAELRTYLDTSTDGEYWLYPGSTTMLGNRAKMYCHKMETDDPLEYVTLVNTNSGDYPAVASPNCVSEVDPPAAATPGVTTFTKILVIPYSMLVTRQDYVFATSTTSNFNMYGQASDCYKSYTEPQSCGPVGKFHMDTRNTGLIIDEQLTWNPHAWKPYPPHVIKSANGTVIDLLCGGYCGGCAPNVPGDGAMYLHYNPNDRLRDDEAQPSDISSY